MSSNNGLAPTPPLGWNSWDCYGTTVREAEVKANADYMAEQLARYGWRYVVVDIQWSEPDAKAGGYRPNADLIMDDYGRLLPLSTASRPQPMARASSRSPITFITSDSNSASTSCAASRAMPCSAICRSSIRPITRRTSPIRQASASGMTICTESICRSRARKPITTRSLRSTIRGAWISSKPTTCSGPITPMKSRRSPRRSSAPTARSY